MSSETVVQVIGAPVVCARGTREAWREAAVLVGSQLAARFGRALRVDYFDLFDPSCPPLPPEAQLPVVLVNGELLSSGGKISVPAISKRLEVLGLEPYSR